MKSKFLNFFPLVFSDPFNKINSFSYHTTFPFILILIMLSCNYLFLVDISSRQEALRSRTCLCCSLPYHSAWCAVEYWMGIWVHYFKFLNNNLLSYKMNRRLLLSLISKYGESCSKFSSSRKSSACHYIWCCPEPQRSTLQRLERKTGRKTSKELKCHYFFFLPVL